MNSSRKALFVLQIAALMLVLGGVDRQLANAAPGDNQLAAGERSQDYGTTGGAAGERREGETGRTTGAAVDDSVITAKVKSALIADDDVKGLDINVRTRRGEVVLTGMADNQNQVERAVQIASNVEGVKTVSNRLSVKKENEK